MTRTPLLLLLLACPQVSAQGLTVTYVTPKGAEFVEGNSTSSIMFGQANSRVQQNDANLIGQAIPLIRAIGWRRDGMVSGPAKSPTLTIHMAHSDFATIGTNFAANYKTPQQTVFARRIFNLPDWSVSSGKSPSPFDAIVPLDMPFLYNGVDALLYDVINELSTTTAYTQDWFSSMAEAYGNYPTDLGGGCTTANGAMKHKCAFKASATLLSLGFSIAGAPASSSVVLALGVTDPNLTVPGLLCGTLHVDPLVTLPLGSASALGELALTFPVTTPWSTAFAGATLLSQAFAPDASLPAMIPVAFSNGLRCFAPTIPGGGTAPIRVKRLYLQNTITGATGTFAESAVPTLYGY